jgi:hypothetical protein
MKPSDGRYQTATQVKVLSPVIINVREVDSFHLLEDRMRYTVMERYITLFRGLSPWYDIERKLQELGRARIYHRIRTCFCGQVRPKCVRVCVSKHRRLHRRKEQSWRREVVDNDKLKRRGVAEYILAVGLTHSRGVIGVTPYESRNEGHSKGLALVCKVKGTHRPVPELETLWKRN